MKIRAIHITHHRISLEPPFRAAWDSVPRESFGATIVRVQADDGLEGVGSGDVMAGFEAYAALFIGADVMEIERHGRILDNIAFHAGRCWPLDVALWDLAGKISGQPVWRMLGGKAKRVRAYASSGSLKSADEMADLAARYVAEGYPAMKVRFHRPDWREDVATLAAVRARIGDKLALMVDCNQGWRMPWDDAEPWTFDDALPVARALKELDVFWMEEPLHRGDYAGMAALRRAVGIRLAGGELTRERHEFDLLIEKGAVDVLQPDAVLTGGLTGLRHIAAKAAAHGLIFTPHTWGNGIGLIANLHLAAGVAPPPFIEYPYDPPEWVPAARDFPLAEPFLPDGDGYLNLTEAPGLGVTLDEERLAATRIA